MKTRLDKLERFKGTVLANGYGIVAKQAMRDRNLSTTAKAIYAYLCTYGERAFPSRNLICNDLGINKDTFHKRLNELKSAGYISVRTERHGGKFQHNVYTIETVITPCPKKPDPVESDPVQPDPVQSDTKNTRLNSTRLNSTTNNTVIVELEKFGLTKSAINEIAATVDQATANQLIKYAQANNLGAGWILNAARDPSKRPPPPGSEAAIVARGLPKPDCPNCRGTGEYKRFSIVGGEKFVLNRTCGCVKRE